MNTKWIGCVIVSFALVGCEGPQGPAGADGADGENGVDGQDGVDGENGVDGQDGEDGLLSDEDVYWAEATGELPAWTGVGFSAWCDAGDIVMSGGYSTTNPYPFDSMTVYDNTPTSYGDLEGWYVAIANDSGSPYNVTVHVICVDMP